MKLYLVSCPERDGWDTFDSFVCAAVSEDAARQTWPREADDIWPHISWDAKGQRWTTSNGEPLSDCWPHDLGSLTVVFLGLAAPEIKAGVICASFNAG